MTTAIHYLLGYSGNVVIGLKPKLLCGSVSANSQNITTDKKQVTCKKCKRKFTTR